MWLIDDINNINIDHPWVNFFKANPNKKVGLLHWGNDTKYHPLLMGLPHLEPYMNTGGLYLTSYLGFKSNVTGFFLRSLTEKNFKVTNLYTPSMYFTESFEKNFINFIFGDKIVILEGILDAEAFVAITGYPYVIACLGNIVKLKQAMFLGFLTDSFVFCPDNDIAGSRGLRETKRIFNKLRARYEVIEIKGSKDVGDIYFNQSLIKLFKIKVNKVLTQRNNPGILGL